MIFRISDSFEIVFVFSIYVHCPAITATLSEIYFFQLDYAGLTGLIKFDNKGFRGNFALDVVELMEGGQTVVGTWNSSQLVPLNISRIFVEDVEENFDISNRTFIVMTTLVSLNMAAN